MPARLLRLARAHLLSATTASFAPKLAGFRLGLAAAAIVHGCLSLRRRTAERCDSP